MVLVAWPRRAARCRTFHAPLGLRGLERDASNRHASLQALQLLQPSQVKNNCELAMAFNLRAMASNLLAMMASNLVAIKGGI